jgi:hypothetical protein
MKHELLQQTIVPLKHMLEPDDLETAEQYSQALLALENMRKANK